MVKVKSQSTPGFSGHATHALKEIPHYTGGGKGGPASCREETLSFRQSSPPFLLIGSGERSSSQPYDYYYSYHVLFLPFS